jgi:hypothetical protein
MTKSHVVLFLLLLLLPLLRLPQVYLEDLAELPENPWALKGLRQVYEAMGPGAADKAADVSDSHIYVTPTVCTLVCGWVAAAVLLQLEHSLQKPGAAELTRSKLRCQYTTSVLRQISSVIPHLLLCCFLCSCCCLQAASRFSAAWSHADPGLTLPSSCPSFSD